MSLSTHVLDATAGRPAAGMEVSLWCRTDDGGYEMLHSGTTDTDGRIAGWRLRSGRHRLVFSTGDWWRRRDTPTFHPEAVVTFTVADPDAHHHVPLLLSPFAYSTYKGS
ncbi:MAG TPA: hydroxyisourate hydrolase [Stackebrandtia sp.]|uniref:hydroxyisourate hydrolase n=1 Tax=Stackebrandtia sp. TaxID=2023065 RepID=UPI002D42954E|nr:hydroxyisourate hydrolase [Stackebrandtia sp.]HZE39752.1 hydroxyisourate hydrolase [Stackebrandtia sp.]